MTTQATCTPAQASAILGLSRQMIYRLIKEGKLPAVRIGCRYRLIRADLLNALRRVAAGESGAAVSLGPGPCANADDRVRQRPED